MKHTKYIGLCLLLVLLVIIVVSRGCRGRYMSPERALRNFSNRIERGNLRNLTLTIYYRDVSTSPFFLSVEDLVGRGWYDHKIVVDGNELEEHIELLQLINANNLTPFTHPLPMHATLYYVFEVNGRKIFGVVPQPGRNNSSMFINDVEFEWNDAFFDVIRPFLPEDEVRNWDASLQEWHEE